MRVHIKAMTRTHPAEAQNIEVILDFINQLVATLKGLLSLFGFSNLGKG